MDNIVFLYPGQGSQKIGMAKDFYDSSTKAKEIIQNASDRVKVDFKKLMFEENDDLSKTQFTQPAIFLSSVIANTLFNEACSVTPDITLGHSLGEFSAIFGAGALDMYDGVELVQKRGLLMQEDCSTIEAGMMVLVGLSDEKVEEICIKSAKDVYPANYNSDGQIVVAGIKNDLISMQDTFKDAGAKRVILLDMSVASHCPLLANAATSLKTYLDKYIKNSFKCDVISNVTAEGYNTKDEAISLLVAQLTNPVKYKHSIQNIDSNVKTYIEFGGSVLKGLNRKTAKNPTISVTDMASLEDAVKTFS
ncbi:MAG: Malonyl CoA-acyl carrier protein transacylase (EC [uncultured Campylobacterales bacterium]|uniref:Malonyl CoA-acyl carrier protein transacylase n=1 Tax=uncultured Campylobacterales bacterium TaxID=352960 RepID=A0A6S6SEK1_9BACT|nr:MAG: Malonyl CoA-acyl carrier protein transacylase (EC [uncultured Campylobacterales bacterium]